MKDPSTGKSTSSIITRTEALKKARQLNLDLVLGKCGVTLAIVLALEVGTGSHGGGEQA